MTCFGDIDIRAWLPFQINPLDFALAGAVLGGSYRFLAGPKRAAAAAAVGAGIGLTGGIAAVAADWASDMSLEERWRYEFKLQKAQNVAYEERRRKAEEEAKMAEETGGNWVTSLRRVFGFSDRDPTQVYSEKDG